MNELADYLKAHEIMISCTESFTVGRFASSIGSVPGISLVFKGGLVCYQSIIKEKVLHVDRDLVEKYGVVSREVAQAMCVNGAKLFDSDVCISFTGNAGPDAMEGKPVGRVYIGIYIYDTPYIYEYNLKGTRNDIANEAVSIGTELVLKLLKKNENKMRIKG